MSWVDPDVVSWAWAEELAGATGAAILATSADGALQVWSRSAERLLGVQASDAGKRFWEVVRVPSGADAQLVHWTVLGGHSWGLAPDPARRDEAMVWTARPLRGRGETPHGVVYQIRPLEACTVPDDVERLACARAFEHAHESLVVVDRNLEIVAVNRAYAQRARTIADRPLAPGMPILAAAAPGSEDAFIAAVERAFAGEPTRRERTLAYHDGHEHTFAVEYVPLPDEEGRIAHVLFGAIDVARTRELEDRHELVERALRHASVGLLIADARLPDLPLIYASEGATRVTGYTTAELLGRNCRFLHEGLGDQLALDVLRSALARGEACDVVLRNRRKDGTLFWNRLSMAPVRDPDATLTHFVAVQQDVTADVEARQRLRDVEALESASRLAAALAHDFNNLLMVIGSEAALAQDEVAPESEAHASLAHVLRAVSRARVLTRGLLSQARHVRAQPARVSATEVLRGLEQAVAHAVPAAIQVRFVAPAVDATLWIDPALLDQALVNLIFNARDAMPDGGELLITCEVRADEAPLAVFTIADTGHGIPEALQPRVFEPLFTTKSRTRGTGLGLWMARSIVQEAGGAIRFHSIPGRGTRFTIELPCAPGAALPPRPLAERARVEGTRLLVVDSDAPARAALSKLLRARGAEVHVAGDAAGAREVLSAHPDIGLVIADGAHDEMVSAWAEAAPRRAAVLMADEATAHGPHVVVCAKPFTPTELLEAIARVAPLGVP